MARKSKIGRIKKYSKKKKQIPYHEDHTYCRNDFTDSETSTSAENGDHRWILTDFFISSEEAHLVEDPAVTESEDSDGCFANEHFVVLDKAYRYTTDTDLDSFVARINKQNYDNLRLECETINTSAKGFVMAPCERIQFVALYTGDNPGVKMSVTISSTFQPIIMVHRQKLPQEHELWGGIKGNLSTKSKIEDLLTKLSGDKLVVCCGNPDEHFFEQSKVNMSNSAITETDQGATYKKTIRATDCQLLCEGLRCVSCRRYRGTLRKRLSSSSKAVVNCDFVHSKKTHSQMTRSELITKIEQSKDYYKRLEREVAKLQKSLQKRIEEEGVILPEKNHSDLETLFKQHSDDIMKEWPDENCFQRLFWQQQMKQLQLGNKKSMRWHPTIVKWCIYLHSKSAKAYENIRESGFISLPSQRTLYDYSHFLKSKTGFQPDVLEHLIAEAEAKGLFDPSTPWRKYVGLLQDEVKVKQDLVYDHHTGELIGFVDLDKTGNQLVELECSKDCKEIPTAKYVLVLMVRCCTSEFKYPLAAFATDGVTADKLYPIIWRAVELLHVCAKLNVLFVTCDGASPNRRFFHLHSDGNNFVHYAKNLYAPGQNLYFISDAPHLLKTARNCFGNSYSHKMTRRLWKDGKDISWMHIVKLFEEHVEANLFSYCPKLTRSHIDLTAFSQMKVNLAAQVFSKTVADALESLYDESVEETVTFIRYMNDFFDLMNTRNLSEGIRKRNHNLHPYCSVDDTRLDWLTDDFLGYFKSWKTSVEERAGDFSQTAKNGMMLSHQTLEGLEITVKSVVQCIRLLLEQGAPFVLTSVFNQDALEQHFGHYRQKGGACDNPSVFDVRYTINKLRVTGSHAMASVRGNTKRADKVKTIDNEPLRKKPRLR